MRNKSVTLNFYVNILGFEQFGNDYKDYLMVQRDNIQIHFFEFRDLDPKQNYAGVYIRTDDIDKFYNSIIQNNFECIHPAGQLEKKPWGQVEFAMLDPDNNLLTFGQSL